MEFACRCPVADRVSGTGTREKFQAEPKVGATWIVQWSLSDSGRIQCPANWQRQHPKTNQSRDDKFQLQIGRRSRTWRLLMLVTRFFLPESSV
jgi:hypothetical protein